jgi:hypothetical protein
MADPTTSAVTLTQVFAELYRNRNRDRHKRGRLTPEQVAERLHVDDVTAVKAAMETVFFAGLLHMNCHAVTPGAPGYKWHYGVTTLARRIVNTVDLDGMTDELIKAEYHDALAWAPRKKWPALASV